MSCERCRILEDQLASQRDSMLALKATAEEDAQTFARQLANQARQIGALKAKLAAQQEDSDEAGDVKELLQFWKAETGKAKTVDIKPGSKRWEIAERSIQRWGLDRCKVAIIGLAAHPWAGPFGRKAEKYQGSKRFDDLEHAFGGAKPDPKRFENCEALALGPDEDLDRLRDEWVERCEVRLEAFVAAQKVVELSEHRRKSELRRAA